MVVASRASSSRCVWPGGWFGGAAPTSYAGLVAGFLIGLGAGPALSTPADSAATDSVGYRQTANADFVAPSREAASIQEGRLSLQLLPDTLRFGPVAPDSPGTLSVAIRIEGKVPTGTLTVGAGSSPVGLQAKAVPAESELDEGIARFRVTLTSTAEAPSGDQRGKMLVSVFDSAATPQSISWPWTANVARASWRQVFKSLWPYGAFLFAFFSGIATYLQLTGSFDQRRVLPRVLVCLLAGALAILVRSYYKTSSLAQFAAPVIALVVIAKCLISLRKPYQLPFGRTAYCCLSEFAGLAYCIDRSGSLRCRVWTESHARFWPVSKEHTIALSNDGRVLASTAGGALSIHSLTSRCDYRPIAGDPQPLGGEDRILAVTLSGLGSVCCAAIINGDLAVVDGRLGRFTWAKFPGVNQISHGAFIGSLLLVRKTDGSVLALDPLNPTRAAQRWMPPKLELADRHVVALDAARVSGETCVALIVKPRNSKSRDRTLIVLPAQGRGEAISAVAARDATDVRIARFRSAERRACLLVACGAQIQTYRLELSGAHLRLAKRSTPFLRAARLFERTKARSSSRLGGAV